MPGRKSKYHVESHTSAAETWAHRTRQAKASGTRNRVKPEDQENATNHTKKLSKKLDKGRPRLSENAADAPPSQISKVKKGEERKARLSENGADPVFYSASKREKEETSKQKNAKCKAEDEEGDEEFELAELSFGEISSVFAGIAVRSPGGVSDVEKATLDILEDSEYAQDFINYLMFRETCFELKPQFLDDSEEVSPSRRAILVDWLIQIQEHLRLELDTLHMCVAMLDRYCSRAPVTLYELQLVGTTCMLIASKFVERFPPEISTLVKLTDDSYSCQDVLKAEIEILKELEFDLALPISSVFLHRNLKVAQDEDKKFQSLCEFFIDLAICDVPCILFPPSIRAAAALHLGQLVEAERTQTSQTGLWSLELCRCTSYTASQLKPCMARMAKLLSRLEVSKYQGARRKYADLYYHEVSSYPELINGTTITNLLEKS